MLTIGPIALILFAVGISLIVGFVVVANSSSSSHGHGTASGSGSTGAADALRPGAMAAYVPRATAAPAEDARAPGAPASDEPAPAAPAADAPPAPAYSPPPAFGTAAPLAASAAPESAAEPAEEPRAESPPVAPERRDFARQSLARPVYLRRGTPDAPPIRSFAFNISASGVLLAGPADLRLGEPVWMELNVHEGSGPVHATGTVVHETANGHKGLGFDFVAPDDRAMLARLSQDLHAERAGSPALA